MEDEILNKLKYLIKKKGSLAIIAEELELQEYELLGLIEMLKRKGENIEVVGNTAAFCKPPVSTNQELVLPFKESELKFLMLSDTHLASKYDNVKLLHSLYEEAEKRGIKIALHCGDIVDGRYPNRPGNEYEIKKLSGPEQIEYAIKHYPKFSGQTYAITGNHDSTFFKIAGIEVGKELAKAREDITYLGQDVGDLKIGKIVIRLFHGAGAPSYARSYRPQKYLDAQDPRPDILGLGHVHYAFYMKYLQTHVLQTGSLQGLSPYIKAKGWPNDMSAWIVEVDLDSKGKIVGFRPELIEFKEKGPVLVKRRK